MKYIFIIIVVSISLMASGKSYEIVEPDFIKEIQQDAPQIKKRVKQDLKKAQEKLDNFTGEVLLKAIKNRVYYIDKTFTLDRDIPKYNRLGQQIGILYKKGYQFNPVKYIKVIPPDLIIFNVCEKSEARYIKELLATSKYNYKNNFMLVNSGCKNSRVKKSSFNRKVYYLTNEMKKEFKLTETISIVSVDTIENKIRVEVIKTDENNN